MTTSAKTITIGGVSSTSKVDAMGKTENGKTGKSEIARNLPGSPTTAARRRVTLRDVATAAGVSLKTASNVINGTGRMTDATRAKVEAVIEQTGYRVNVAARNLNRDRTGFITLAVPTLTAPYLSELANRVIDAARQRGYLVYVTTYAEGSATGARELLRNFNTTVSDGMILSMSEVEDINPEDLEVDFPLVVVGARTTWGKADHVTPNDVQAAASAAGYMFDCGVKSLAVVGGRGAYDEAKLLGAVEGNAQLRLRGIIEECRRRGMTLDARLVGNVEQEWTIGAGPCHAGAHRQGRAVRWRHRPERPAGHRRVDRDARERHRDSPAGSGDRVRQHRGVAIPADSAHPHGFASGVDRAYRRRADSRAHPR